MKKPIFQGCAGLLLATAFFAAAAHDLDKSEVYADPSGALQIVNANGRSKPTGAFFQSLGTNGRSCSSCHVADQGMSVSTPQLRQRFAQTHGRDPVFAATDGANCGNAKASDAAAHSLLLSHGLFHIALPIPAAAQFTVTVVHDPYGCAIFRDPATKQLMLSTYRRPLPATNLSFLSTMMWDGRESPPSSPLGNKASFEANLLADLSQQAIDATMGHAQAASPPTSSQVADIVSFELGLYTAQIYDQSAGDLRDDGAIGGARHLLREEYYPGINDVLGADPDGGAFDETSMTLFAAWENGGNPNREDREHGSSERRARSDIAAGEVLFNTAPMTISAVRGLNDNAALGNPVSFKGTCTSCHDSPNVGDHSLPLPLDIGTSHSPRAGLENDPHIANAIAELDEPDLPIYLVSGCPSPFSAGQPVSFYTTDLGKGMLTGQCSDVNRVKGPILRGLAARAPYFHNGAAATLAQAVNFYDQRFSMNLTQAQKRQLVAFLNSL